MEEEVPTVPFAAVGWLEAEAASILTCTLSKEAALLSFAH